MSATNPTPEEVEARLWSAQAISLLVGAGYERESVAAAVKSGDWNLLRPVDPAQKES